MLAQAECTFSLFSIDIRRAVSLHTSVVLNILNFSPLSLISQAGLCLLSSQSGHKKRQQVSLPHFALLLKDTAVSIGILHSP